MVELVKQQLAPELLPETWGKFYGLARQRDTQRRRTADLNSIGSLTPEGKQQNRT